MRSSKKSWSALLSSDGGISRAVISAAKSSQFPLIVVARALHSQRRLRSLDFDSWLGTINREGRERHRRHWLWLKKRRGLLSSDRLLVLACIGKLGGRNLLRLFLGRSGFDVFILVDAGDKRLILERSSRVSPSRRCTCVALAAFPGIFYSTRG